MVYLILILTIVNMDCLVGKELESKPRDPTLDPTTSRRALRGGRLLARGASMLHLRGTRPLRRYRPLRKRRTRLAAEVVAAAPRHPSTSSASRVPSLLCAPEIVCYDFCNQPWCQMTCIG